MDKWFQVRDGPEATKGPIHVHPVFNPAELQLGLGSLTEQGLFLSRAGPRTELDPNSSVRPGIVIFHVFGIVFL